MESATLKIPRADRNPNVRAYLAGGGATAALVAGAVIVFLGVAAFVGFNGLPFGADDPADATVNLAAGVPEAAAAAAAPATDAVADDPATPSAAALAEILAALPPGADPGIAGLDPLAPGTGGGPNGPGPTTPGTGGETPAGTAGTLGTAVSGLEEAAGNLGLNLPLGDATNNVTGPIDNTVNDALNNVGGALGNPNLGDQVTGSLNNATNNLLGPNGVGGLLGGNK
jgi:hypothetical protein